VEKFPHLVQLHRKFAEKGLVCVSVDVFEDELKDQPRVVEFLKRQGADFPNFILKDTEANRDAWLAKYGIEHTPAVVLFDRSGKRVRVPEKFSPAEMEELVKDLLAAR
jgi:hypothetical protein